MPSFEILLPNTRAFHWELGPFFYLFRRFWGKRQVTILSDADPKIPLTRWVETRGTVGADWGGQFSNSLMAYLENDCRAEFLVILMADYWITAPVATHRLRTLAKFMAENRNVARLQISVGMGAGSDSEVIQRYDGLEIKDRPEFLRGSLIPGLWSKRLLLQLLEANWSIWHTEIALTRKIKESGAKSYLVMPEIIDYAHIARTSHGEVNLSSFPFAAEIEKFIPDGFKR